jgi:hypothetical protein
MISSEKDINLYNEQYNCIKNYAIKKYKRDVEVRVSNGKFIICITLWNKKLSRKTGNGWQTDILEKIDYTKLIRNKKIERL